MSLRTAVIGVGSLGRQHARIHAALAAEGRTQFVSVCDLNEETARNVSDERHTEWATTGRGLVSSSMYDAGAFFSTGLGDDAHTHDGQLGVSIAQEALMRLVIERPPGL